MGNLLSVPHFKIILTVPYRIFQQTLQFTHLPSSIHVEDNPLDVQTVQIRHRAHVHL